MKIRLIAVLVLTTLFTLTDKGLKASEFCPSYPDQVSFIPEPIPDTCEGQWVQVEGGSTMFDCPITGGYSDLVSTEGGYIFEVIVRGKKLRQQTNNGYRGIDCQLPEGIHHCNDVGSVYEFDPSNPDHYSCIAGFYGGIPEAEYVHDHCVWEPVEIPGWQCKRSYWAEHDKTLYEWKCN